MNDTNITPNQNPSRELYYQFEFSFWWHPFTTEDPLMCKRWNAQFPQIGLFLIFLKHELYSFSPIVLANNKQPQYCCTVFVVLKTDGYKSSMVIFDLELNTIFENT